MSNFVINYFIFSKKSAEMHLISPNNYKYDEYRLKLKLNNVTNTNKPF